MPTFIVRRSLTVTSFIFSSMFSGRASGKNDTSLSSTLRRPSEIANPTAVAVKVLLTENITWGLSGAPSLIHCSASTFPCWSTITLWRSQLVSLAASATNCSTASVILSEAFPLGRSLLAGRQLPSKKTIAIAKKSFCFIILYFTCCSVSPLNGGLPTINSNKSTPIHQISTRSSWPLLLIISGAK